MDHEDAIKRVDRRIRKAVKAKVPACDVPDVVQSIFLSCIKSGYLSEPGRKVPSRTLLATITRRRIADYYRDRKRAPDRMREDFDPPAAESCDTPGNRDEIRHIRSIVAGLDKRYRQIVEARYFHDRADREIARLTGTPLETIRTRRKRAIQAIRYALESAS